MKDPNAPAIPDLDLPPPTQSKAPAAARPSAPAPEDFSFGGGMELERNLQATPQGRPMHGGGKAIDIGPMTGGGDAFDEMDMEIERGGGNVAIPTTTSGRPIQARNSGGLGGGLELDPSHVRSQRPRPQPTIVGPSLLETIGAYVLAGLVGGGSIYGLIRVAHRAGGRAITSFLPRAFDATSTIQSGVMAGIYIVLAVTIGYFGLKVRPRSYAMVVSAAMLILGALAMVTVMLVSTEEHPPPPDGALLIPYVVPAALLLLGAGFVMRGVQMFLDAGIRRVAIVIMPLLGGALIFAALETSFLSKFLK